MKQNNKSLYYQDYPLTDPAYMVVRRAGREIQENARKYFSGRLLDIGCGEKTKQYLIGDSVREYVGLDHQNSLHSLARVDIIGTAYEIPVPDRSFDSVLCTAVLEHLEDPGRALKESFRVLRPGGHALYTVPLFWHIHEAPRDFYRYTKYGLEHLFGEAGFEIVDISALSGFWLTFGSEWNYYLHSLAGRKLSIIARALIALNNMMFPLLDGLDRKWHRAGSDWTWLYLVVARKKKDNG